MDDTTFDNPRYDGSDKGDGKGVVYVKFEGGFGIVISVVRKYVEEDPDEIERFARDVGNLEDGADALTHELSGGFNGIFSRFDEDGDFPGARRFENAGKLGDGLLENVGRANVNFGDYNHDWDI